MLDNATLVASLECIVLRGDVRRRPPFTADCVSIGNESRGLRRLQRSHHGHKLHHGMPESTIHALDLQTRGKLWLGEQVNLLRCSSPRPGLGNLPARSPCRSIPLEVIATNVYEVSQFSHETAARPLPWIMTWRASPQLLMYTHSIVPS